jgi:hypothetical protein
MMLRLTLEQTGESWQFDGDRFLNVELMAIERETGLTASQFFRGLQTGSMLATTGLVWTLKKRHVDPQTQFDSLVFDAESVSLTPVKDPEPEPAPSPVTTPETRDYFVPTVDPLSTNTPYRSPDTGFVPGS